MKRTAACFLLIALCLAGCGAENIKAQPTEPSSTSGEGYEIITQERAKELMAQHPDCVILDVRRQDEFDSGHIPGAICIPNESIGTTPPEGLPDLDQMILVYCRSGNRSKQASRKLADIGYTNVYEFGGIIDWTGETVRQGENTMKKEPDVTKPAQGRKAELSYQSFDGGGPEYSVRIEDETVVSCSRKTFYAKPDHDRMTGAGYTVVFTITGLRPGKTTLTVSGRSPIMPPEDETYDVTVNEELDVTLSLRDINNTALRQ